MHLKLSASVQITKDYNAVRLLPVSVFCGILKFAWTLDLN